MGFERYGNSAGEALCCRKLDFADGRFHKCLEQPRRGKVEDSNIPIQKGALPRWETEQKDAGSPSLSRELSLTPSPVPSLPQGLWDTEALAIPATSFLSASEYSCQTHPNRAFFIQCFFPQKFPWFPASRGFSSAPHPTLLFSQQHHLLFGRPGRGLPPHLLCCPV